MVTRIKHGLLALLLIISLSFSVVFAEPSDVFEVDQSLLTLYENDTDINSDLQAEESVSNASEYSPEGISPSSDLSDPELSPSSPAPSEPSESEGLTNEEDSDNPDTPAQEPEPVKPKVTAKVFKKGKYYYYNDPKVGGIRTTAGFVTCRGRLYYIQKGGKILTGKTLKIGKKIYHTTTWGPVFRGVHKWGNHYYYSDLKTGEVYRKARFVKYNDRLYYIQKGGVIAAGRTFTVGNKQYRAYPNGKIAVGAYRWGNKCYFSDPKTGEWVKKECFIWWKKHRYYIQPDSTLAANKAFVIKHFYPYYADNYCRVAAIPIDNKTKSPVLKVAQSQVGIITGEKYWRWYFGTRFRDTDRTPWCGTFVGWCYRQAGLYSRISSVGNIAYVPCYSRFANRKGKWISTSKARGGDIAVFGRNRHVGVVEKVYKGYLVTVEGNSGPTAAYGCGKPGAVTRKVYRINDSDIKGIIRP